MKSTFQENTGTRALYTTASLAAWLRTQDLSADYDYRSPTDCMLLRYFRAKSNINPQGAFNDLPDHHPFKRIALAEPQTYGAALERATA